MSNERVARQRRRALKQMLDTNQGMRDYLTSRPVIPWYYRALRFVIQWWAYALVILLCGFFLTDCILKMLVTSN